MKKFFGKVKGFLKENKKLMAVAMAVMCMMCMIALPASASDGTSDIVTTADFTSVMDALTAQINVSTIVQVLVVVVGASVGFVFMWWGVRKLIAVIMKAVRSGRAGV